jgi:3'-phosphoadenosine 5'-phosphosulfate sulfotransferase (PAPS reductase)/FAD synthetase
MSTPNQLLFPDGRPLGAAVDEARGVLARAIGAHAPSHVYALMSGGHDSLCATHLASGLPGFSGVVHVNTGIGIEATRAFVRETCARHGWPLLELHPPGPPYRDKHGRPWGVATDTAYESLVLKWGFPGPRGHTLVYNRLKERCLAALLRRHPGRRKVALVTGVRRQESRRRMGHIVAEQTDGRRLWVAPLCYWSDDDKRAYIAAEGLPENPVAKRLCMSGECLCGCYARPEELAEVRAVCPRTYAYIRSLEERVRAAGLARCRWGEKPPPQGRRESPGQLSLPLCHSCEARAEGETVEIDSPPG